MARRAKPGIADARWIAPARTRGRAADGAGFAAGESRIGKWHYRSSSAANWLARLGCSRNAKSDRPEAIRACSSQRAACLDGGLVGKGAQTAPASAFPANWISTSEKRGVAGALPGRGTVRGEQQRCGTKPD